MAKYKRKGMIHRIAHCENCDWQDEGFKTSMRKAKEHAEKTGHRINIETGIWGVIE